MTRARRTAAQRWSIRTDELELHRENGCVQQLLPESLGAGHSKIVQLDPDLSYIETLYMPSKDVRILSRIDNDEPRMVVTLGLKGVSRFSDYKGGEVIFNEGFTTVTTFTSSLGERSYEADKPIEQLRFSISRRWLSRYFKEEDLARLFGLNTLHAVSHRPITANGQITARRLLDCNLSKEGGQLLVHSLALSILASELSPVCGAESQDRQRFNRKDMAVANLARDILFEEFKNPPSVGALAKRVGVNQFKLKSLFHHFFNSTPFGVLTDIRMTEAYRLLQSTRCHVSVAAHFVGYNHASNFSAAFMKYFGIPPKSIAKQ